MPTGNQYRIVAAADGAVQIAASTYYGYRAALAFLKQECERRGGICVGAYFGDADIADAERPETNSVRVMFYNVYGNNSWYQAKRNENGKLVDANGNLADDNSDVVKTEVYGDSVPPESLRQDLQFDLIRTYLPDVLGFQEFTSGSSILDILSSPKTNYYANFEPLLTETLGYTKVCVGGPDGEETKNRTPMYYNDQKLVLIDSGFVLYTYHGNQTKSITWAIFRDKSTDNLFAVFNTHFEYTAGEEGDTKRESNATELLATIKTVLETKSEYKDIPVIMGGDLNFWDTYGTTESRQKPYKVLTEGGMTLVSNLSGVETNSSKTYHGYYEYDATNKIYDMNKASLLGSYNLDYIFVGNNSDANIVVKKFFVIEDDVTLRASDHSPTLVDFVLN